MTHRAATACETGRLPNWFDRSSYKREWASRARVAARLCEHDRWICDLGCGMQELRYFLPRNVMYLPADLNDWTQDTEICDLDAGLMPVRSLRLSDVCVMLGVVGHLREPGKCFLLLSRDVEDVLFSYQSRDFSRGVTLHKRANDFALDDLYRLVEHAGFEIIRQVQYRRFTFIRARNTRFDSAASARRDALRSAYVSRPLALRDAWTRVVLKWRTRKAARYRVV